MALDKDEVATRVLAIAERLLEEGGSAQLQARTIAREAGVSVGSIYNLFGDLADLHRAVNMTLLDRLGAAGAEAMRDMQARGVVRPRERLIALANAYIAFVERHAGAWSALLAFNRGPAAGSHPSWYTERLDTLFAIIARVLDDGGYGLDPVRRDLAARALWSSVHGIVTSGYVGAGRGAARDEIRAQVDILVECFTAGLEAIRDGKAEAR